MSSNTLPDQSDPASPLHYPANQTALVLLDFQNFIVDTCGETGTTAVATAKGMRDWALQDGILVLHSLVGVDRPIPPQNKARARLEGRVESLKNNTQAIAEHNDLLPSSDKEYVVYKTPGIVSGLRADGEAGTAMELLRKHDIKSLILCGLSTSGCVLRTAVPSTDDGFVITVVEDGCGDPKKDVCKMIMETLLPGSAFVVSASEFLEQWKARSSRH